MSRRAAEYGATEMRRYGFVVLWVRWQMVTLLTAAAGRAADSTKAAPPATVPKTERAAIDDRTLGYGDTETLAQR